MQFIKNETFVIIYQPNNIYKIIGNYRRIVEYIIL